MFEADMRTFENFTASAHSQVAANNQVRAHSQHPPTAPGDNTRE
jgi:hypothetical protein